jgi:hypothetical protein
MIKALTQLFEDLDTVSFVRISWLNWIGHVNRMDSKQKYVKYLTIILMEVN